MQDKIIASKMSFYTPQNISIKSTLNKIQYSTQLILVLFKIKVLNGSSTLNLVLKFHPNFSINTFKVSKLQFDTLTKF
jgi:hypothetical protein